MHSVLFTIVVFLMYKVTITEQTFYDITLFVKPVQYLETFSTVWGLIFKSNVYFNLNLTV